MTRSQSILLRLVLFVLGASIITLIFFLSTKNTELSMVSRFTWISISLMYLVLCSPLVFFSFVGKVGSFAMLLTGIGLYIIISIVLVILANVGVVVEIGIAFIAQAILFVFFAALVYVAYFGGSGTGRAERLASIKKLQSLAAAVDLKISDLPNEYSIVHSSLNQIIEDLRYLTPLKSKRSVELEDKIMDNLHFLGQYCDSAMLGGNISAFEREIKNLQALVRQRKAL
ncbi:MAG: hypothetical protein LBF87_03630 [Treponema sp.]|nr:hypothetical protein [Treponema sp.]